MSSNKQRRVVVSGMRPTGRLHLGHYHGVIVNWVRLQDDPDIDECYYFVADWHALTTEYDSTSQISKFSKEVVIDWLAYGVDPNKATLFVQSRVPEHAELNLMLSMITPLSWLERVPSYKELQKELKGKDLSTYGFLGYPLLQTADVAIYNATDVPVGEDQVAHLELAREIVRRFNRIFKTDILVEPQALMTHVPKLPGTDGRKMSKSYDNSIYLSDDPETVRKKVMPMMTDPARVTRADPGDPEKCPVYDYHKIYSDDTVKEWVVKGCTTAGIGCVDCKREMLRGMDKMLAPFREKRREIAAKPGYVAEVLGAGNEGACKVARENLKKVKEALGL